MLLHRLMLSCQHLFGQFRRRLMLILLLSSSLALAGADLDRLLLLAAEKYDDHGVETVDAWRRLLLSLAHQGEAAKIRQVNEFFNRKIHFDEDVNVWGVRDYWATPLEVLGRTRGDCEDFAIAKYATLRILGVPAEKLQLTYVKARIAGSQSDTTQAHMVLGYYQSPNDEPLVLDNLISEVRPASRRPDLSPVFSFNAEGLWVSGAASKQTHSTERLSRWRRLLARMREEGIE
jgi:predicted transglutaminase-like cysteine proteinase